MSNAIRRCHSTNRRQPLPAVLVRRAKKRRCCLSKIRRLSGTDQSKNFAIASVSLTWPVVVGRCWNGLLMIVRQMAFVAALIDLPGWLDLCVGLAASSFSRPRFGVVTLNSRVYLNTRDFLYPEATASIFLV